MREDLLETSRKSSDLLDRLAPRERLEILEFLVKTERRVREEVMVTRAPRVCLVRMEPMDCEVLKATLGLPALLVVMVGWGRQVRWDHPDLLEPWWRERRCRGPLVLMVLTEPRESQETLVQRERWEPEETKDPEELLEKMAFKVLQVLRGRKDEWAMWVNPACRVRRATLVRLVSWDPLASKEPPDCPASPASRVFRACRETPGRRAEKETPGRPGWTARTELMGSQD